MCRHSCETRATFKNTHAPSQGSQPVQALPTPTLPGKGKGAEVVVPRTWPQARTVRREGHDPEGRQRRQVAAVVDHVEVCALGGQRAHERHQEDDHEGVYAVHQAHGRVAAVRAQQVLGQRRVHVAEDLRAQDEPFDEDAKP